MWSDSWENELNKKHEDPNSAKSRPYTSHNRSPRGGSPRTDLMGNKKMSERVKWSIYI